MTGARLNQLIAMLPQPAWQRIEGAATIVSAMPGDVLIDSGEPIVDLFFPLDSVASLEQAVRDDIEDHASSPGVALAGNEGAVGVEALLGAEDSTNRATVRIGGQLVRIGAATLIEEFARAGVFQRLVLHCADALMGQSCAISACERVHAIRQRLVRWLLMFADRAPAGSIRLTQESLAQLLAVRRSSVSDAASELQDDALIAYQRGSIVIVDRHRLEAGACSCYREIKARYSDLS